MPHVEPAAALLAAQADATAQWRAAVADLRLTLAKLTFPLGCPVQGEDIEDIERTLMEWIDDGQDPATLAWVARDIVAEHAVNSGADANDAKRF